jgi:hypothetical protein
MVLQVGLQPVLGAFGFVLGGQATKSTVLVRPKDLFVLILSWEARFSWTNGTSCWPSPVMGDFGCVLSGQATKSTVCVRPKDIFLLILDKRKICLPSILVLVQNFLQKVP